MNKKKKRMNKRTIFTQVHNKNSPLNLLKYLHTTRTTSEIWFWYSASQSVFTHLFQFNFTIPFQKPRKNKEPRKLNTQNTITSISQVAADLGPTSALDLYKEPHCFILLIRESSNPTILIGGSRILSKACRSQVVGALVAYSSLIEDSTKQI